DTEKSARVSDSCPSDSDLALESLPPVMLAQSPHVSQEGFGLPPPSVKRTRAEIATPKRPGTDEARAQLAMEYINTPDRAPSAMKRPMRSGSPLGRRTADGDDMLASSSISRDDGNMLGRSPLSLVERTKEALLHASSAPVPRFPLALSDIAGCADMMVDHPAPGSDEAVFGSPTAADSDEAIFGSPAAARSIRQSVSPLSEAKMGVASLAITGARPRFPSAENTMGDAMLEDECEAMARTDDGDDGDDDEATAACTPSVDQPGHAAAMAIDSDPEPAEAMAIDTVSHELAENSETGRSPATVAVVVDSVSPESILEAALKAVGPGVASPTGHDAAAPRAAVVMAPTTLPHVRMAGAARAELTTARIFDDPDLMNAAAVPLPATPSMGRHATTPLTKQGTNGSPDFYIPADWLMNPGTSSRGRQQHGAADSPLKRFSSPSREGDSLIPVTPANQKLLDSLEIQWVSPQQVPKFSEADVNAIRAEYEERMRRQNELREKLLLALKDEYAENMRKQEERAEQVLKEAEELFQAHIEQREHEFARRLEEQQQEQQQELAHRDEERRAEAAEFTREIDSAISERADIVAERDDLRTMLDDYVATSTRLLDEKEAEGAGLTRELGKLTLERQRLQEQLDDALARAEALATDRGEALARSDALSAETARLEQLAAALRNDVLVAEERSTKIKGHAENTLAKANDEITSAHEQLAASREETATLKSQAIKADAKARSLQIQLDSMKRQNEELLKLCEGLGV
ncbi:hypothetical protein LPJ61_005076, partial [Coemansia biformis]